MLLNPALVKTFIESLLPFSPPTHGSNRPLNNKKDKSLFTNDSNCGLPIGNLPS